MSRKIKKLFCNKAKNIFIIQITHLFLRWATYYFKFLNTVKCFCGTQILLGKINKSSIIFLHMSICKNMIEQDYWMAFFILYLPTSHKARCGTKLGFNMGHSEQKKPIGPIYLGSGLSTSPNETLHFSIALWGFLSAWRQRVQQERKRSKKKKSIRFWIHQTHNSTYLHTSFTWLHPSVV